MTVITRVSCSRSGPWSPSARPMTRSLICSRRRPAQVTRSTVSGEAVSTPRRIRSKRVAVKDFSSTRPCASKAGTRAGSRSEGGACSYSRS